MRKNAILISVILLIADVLVLYLSFRLGIELRNLLVERGHLRWRMIAPVGYTGLLFQVIIFIFFNLYPGYGLTAVKELERSSRATMLLFLFLAGFLYLNKPFQDYSRAFLILSWLPAMIFIPVARFTLRNILSRFDWYGLPVVIIGTEELSREFAQTLRRIRRIGWRPLEIIPVDNIKQEHLKEIVSDIAVFLPETSSNLNQYARLLNQHFRRVITVQTGTSLGSVWVEPRDLDGQLGLEFHYHLFDPISRLLKRGMDVVGAIFFSIVLLPLIGLLALWIKLDSSGPILFRQTRLGFNFRPFSVLKFRTMVVNAEQRLEELLEKDEKLRQEYEQFHKINNDPRVTRAGKWLRRFSLDELPQLWNVLKGEMSLVGPRAYMPSELAEMGDYSSIILRVRPGLTGWWQVMGRHNTPFQRRLEMDEYYISNWSLWMDFYILMKTAWVILSGRGA